MPSKISLSRIPRTEVHVALFFLVLPLVFYFNFWYEKGFWAISDSLIGGIPNYRLWLDSIGSGFSAFLWNPYIESGAPSATDIQYCSYYPLRLLFCLLPFQTAYNYHLLLHFSLGGWFTYLYLRSVGCSRAAAILGGLALMFSPTTNMRIIHTSVIFSIIWFPLVLFFLEKGAATKNGKYIVLAALACVMQLFGGFLQAVVYSGILYIVYLVFRIYPEFKEDSGAGRRLLGFLALFGLIWGLIVSVVVLPTMEISSFVGKERVSFEHFSYMSLHPMALLAYINPHLLGDITAYTPQAVHEYSMLFPLYGITTHEHQIYVGIVVFVFAVFSLKYFRIDSRIVFWSFIWLFTILFSFGEHFRLFSEFVYQLPVLGSFRVPGRILFLSAYSLIFLFALSVDRVLGMDDAALKRVVRFLGVASGVSFVLLGMVLLMFRLFAALGGAGLDQLTYHHPRFEFYFVPVSVVVRYFRFSNPLLYLAPLFLLGLTFFCWISLQRRQLRYLPYGIGLILLVDLWSFVYPMNSQWYRPLPHSEIVDFLQQNMSPTDRYYLAIENEPQYHRIGVDTGLVPNLGECYRLPCIAGYMTFPKKNYFSGFSYLSILPDFDRYIVDNRFLSMLGMKYVAVPTGSGFEQLLQQGTTNYRKAVEFAPFTVYENLRSKQRFFSPSEVRSMFNVNPTAAVTDTVVHIDAAPGEISRDFDATKILSFDYRGGTATVQVDGEKDSFVVFAENYYPGWSVELDGRPTRLLSVDGLLMGAFVPKGKHQLQFNYFPATLKLGMIACALGMVLAVVSFCYCDRTARRRNAPSTDVPVESATK